LLARPQGDGTHIFRILHSLRRQFVRILGLSLVQLSSHLPHLICQTLNRGFCAEIAYSGWSFASLTLLRKVEEQPQLLAVFVAAAVVAVVEDLPISDLDDSSNLDCIYCLKDHNYFVGFATEGVYYKCLQHKHQVAH